MEKSAPDFIKKMNLIKQKVHWQRKDVSPFCQAVETGLECFSL